jgi:hypothetical protein
MWLACEGETSAAIPSPTLSSSNWGVEPFEVGVRSHEIYEAAIDILRSAAGRHLGLMVARIAAAHRRSCDRGDIRSIGCALVGLETRAIL